MNKTMVWVVLLGLLGGSIAYKFAGPQKHDELHVVSDDPNAEAHHAKVSDLAGTVSAADARNVTVTPATGAPVTHAIAPNLTVLVAQGDVVEEGQRLADMAMPHEHWSFVSFIPHNIRNNIRGALGPSIGGDVPAVTHMFMALVVLLLGLGLSLSSYRRYKSLSEDELILPSKTWNVLAFFDLIVEVLLNTMEGMMPRKDAIAALPLITAFALFILMCNLLGMVPGFLPATDNLNTTAALATICFLAYNFWGFKKQGVVKYLQHFAGPIWWLSWFMFPLEIISHLARPLSLAVRLMGNMFGDHLVLGIILSFGLLVMPLPVMLLGMIVCFVQTAVFTLLAIVYVALAVEEHHHDDAHHHAEAAAH